MPQAMRDGPNPSSAAVKTEIAPAEARAIAKEAYIYGFPVIDNSRIQYEYFVDRKNPQFKAPWNDLANIPRVYTPADTAIQTPNSDTPYSWIGLDLRTEPIVFTVPSIEKNRYFSLQMIDLYTYNFDYLGSRTTGNDGGSFLVAGPGWQGEAPESIKKVFRCETEIASAQFRTQLFNPGDLDNVKKIQDGYIVQPLSQFLGRSAPKPAPAIHFPQPLTREEQRTSLQFFNDLNFFLQFCPTVPSEKDLIARFATLGIGAGRTFDPLRLSPEIRQAVSDGMADAWKEFAEFKKTSIDTGKVTSDEAFGTRQFLKNNYLYRMAGAVLGIYGNSKEEAMYPVYFTDAVGQKLDASRNQYVLRFAADQFPPVHSFWSLTLYALPSSLLSANVLNRYLINSPMLPNLKRDDDGGLTLYIRHESPGKEKESNWLPAPSGPFWLALRLYWPKQAALDGTWTRPPLKSIG